MRTINALILLGTITITITFTSLAFAAEDCIIDPELMNKETWSEPIFSAPDAVNSRTPASTAEEVAVKAEKNSDQYLQVQKTIPHSEPSMSQAWIEWTVLHEN